MSKIERVVDRTYSVLEKCPGPVTRDYLIKQRKELGALSQVAKTVDVGRDENSDSAKQYVELPSSPVKRAPASFGQGAVTRRPSVGALVLTPSRSDVARLFKPYTGGGEPACLRYSDIVLPSVALILMARVGDLPRLADKLSFWGFKRFEGIYALAPPSEPDLMNVDAIAICERGRPNLVKHLQDWPAEKDPLKLADSLLNEVAGRRVPSVRAIRNSRLGVHRGRGELVDGS
jgi:hypothetical protein